MARNQGAVAHLEKIRGTNTADERMPVSGSDVSTARNNSVTVCGFSYFDAANAIETLGEGRSEAFGHVLDGHDSRAILGISASTWSKASVPPVDAPMAIFSLWL